MFTNNCLPKYFYGDKMNQDEQSEKNILNFSEDVHLSEPNLSSIPSPCSSLASTKKLEWDSGADIGYIYDSVKHSRKSKSYPSLIMDPLTSKSNAIEAKAKKHSSTGAKNVNMLACIGEGDTMKSPSKSKSESKENENKNKKIKSFKHSTPLDHRQTVKSCVGDSSNEKATSPILKHHIKDECLQTTLVHSSSKEVQTDFENIPHLKHIEHKSLQTDITDILGPQSMSSSSSKSSSFKYIPGSEIQYINSNNTNSNSNSQSLSNGTIKSGITIKSSSCTTSSRRDETESGSCSPLGKMISTQYSKNLIVDIDKSLGILEKFIKSKNYSSDTKKHYAKKIVTKIINNRYSDDTDSVSGTSNKISEIKTSLSNQDESMDKKYVECGIQCDEINKKSQIISDRNDCKIKESLEKLNALQTDLKNWRDAQTLSEKLFEARKTHKSRTTKNHKHNHEFSSSASSTVEDGKRDYLIQHSKNERKRQLSWINNEISYLQKLKELLQLKDQSNTNTSSSTTTTTTKKMLTKEHDLDDVEKKFNKEFGLLPSDSKHEALDKLSKYLSNEQIKFILDHDVHKKPEGEGKASLANLNSSYNSHKNSIYPHMNKSGQHTSCSSSSSPLDVMPKTCSAVDATTQCSISKKSDSSAKIEEPTKQSSSSSEYDESLIIDKENLIEKVPQKVMNTFKKGGTAYFLTFEEESQCDVEKEERRILEQVVVKIPKYHHRSVNKVNSATNSVNNTLEEYLLRNRPSFVRNANWRWTHVRSLDSQESRRNLFTCHEMKEMSKRKYNNLPEVREKVKNNKTENERKHNRFMANIFSKKLQRKALQGHICLATCKNVMTSD